MAQSRRPTRTLAVGAILALLASLGVLWTAESSRASGCTITWVGDFNTDWTFFDAHGAGTADDDSNWSDNTLPDASDHACLNNATTVTLSSPVTVSHYSIEAVATLDINPFGSLRAMADSTNAGTIRMFSGGGGGSTLATHNGNALDVEKLTNTGTIAIPAGGTNGANLVGDLLNQGTISVSHADAFFTRFTASESRNFTLTNAGTISVAAAPAFLKVEGTTLRQASTGTINGPGPVLVANDGGANVGHLEIAGGTINAGADVRMQGTSTLDFVAGASTATGKISVDNNSQVTGNVPLGITIEISPFANLRSLVDWTNAGTIRMFSGGGGGSTLATHNGNALDVEKLTNTGTIAIPAGGTNGANLVGDLLNQGTISVSHADAFFTRFTASESRNFTLTNAGTISVAAAPAFLKVEGTTLRQASTGTINGPGPVLVANDGGANVGHLEIAGGTINAGADVRMQGTSTLDFVAGASTATGKISVDNNSQVTGNVPLGITIDISGFATLRALADWTNAGTIRLLSVPGGGGQLATENGTAASAEVLTNTGTISATGATNIIRLAGDLVNQGTISISHPTVTLEEIFEARDGKLTNAASGNINVAAGGSLTLVNGEAQSFDNAGTVAVTGTFIAPGYTQTAGVTRLIGASPAQVRVEASGILALQGGRLEGNGSVSLGNVQNTGGTVAPGLSPGTLTFAGNYTQGPGGTLAIEISGPNPGTGHDQLVIGNTVSLAGTLTVNTSGFTPATDQLFKIIDAPSPPASPTVSGTFATVLETGHDYDVLQNPTDVTLEANAPPPPPPDGDGDGVPDSSDACPTQAASTANGCPAVADTDPPQTSITKGPKKTTRSSTAKFKFSSDEPGSTFRCKLDKKPFKACSSPKTYRNLKPGKHKLTVATIDAAGNVDPTPATRRWKVEK